MRKGKRICVENQLLFSTLLTIKDPRVGGRVQYPLINVLAIALCALICGADTWKGIELFGYQRKRWLSQHLDLSSGIPSHYTFARVFSLINPTELHRCFGTWIMQIYQL